MSRTISVIIPTYNEGKNIARLLNQLIQYFKEESCNNGFLDGEIIVVDGDSTDQTVEICRQFPITIINGPHGRGRQMNAGAEHAKGDVLFFLHADSSLNPLTFKEIFRALEQGHQWGCCRMKFNEDTFFFRMVSWGSHIRANMFGQCYGDQGIFCERKLFFHVGGYPVSIMEDLLMSKRLCGISRPKVIDATIVTSTRRFREEGPFRTLIKMQVQKILLKLGVLNK